MAYELKTPDAPATPKQRAYLAKLERRTNYGEEITMGEAAERIAAALNNRPAKQEKVVAMEPRNTMPKVDERVAAWKKLIEDAWAAGKAAAETLGDPFNGPYSMPCGFASVQIKPGTSAFAKWLVKEKIASKDDYRGGVYIWIGDYNQSINHKEKHAYAMADVIAKAGYNAYGQSRLD